MSKELAKATYYVGLLDTARCSGNWEVVPELVRKTAKHAPFRKCLALAAQGEYQVFIQTTGRSTREDAVVLNAFIPQLVQAVEAEENFQEDALQASVCLGWIHWVLDDPKAAADSLPNNFVEALGRADGGIADASGWTRVSALKGIFIKGVSLERIAGPAEALEVLSYALPLLSRISHDGTGPEQRIWTESLLTRGCFLAGSRPSPEQDLSFFRVWAKFWESTPGQGVVAAGQAGPDPIVPRREIWRLFYVALSEQLKRTTQSPLGFEVEHEHPDSNSFQAMSKLEQRAEFQRAQTIYENILLQQIRFPGANENNDSIEEWAEMVMGSWKVLCGDTWQDEDLGEGGKEVVGRGVLDILYRAASESFHSTAILRHLFQVHASLAEFDLAFKAFESYLEIVKKGQSRVEKSRESESSLDSDEIVLSTAAEAITVLCRFGKREQAERAKDIGGLIETWLKIYTDRTRQKPNGTSKEGHDVAESSPWSRLPPKSLAAGYRAIAISQAQWARYTFEASARSSLQGLAITNFRKSLEPGFDDVHNVQSLYGLGLLLAETRNLPAAIETIKRALVPPQADSQSRSGRFRRERELIPVWHLLALLLSAREEFGTASKACEAAFEQFKSPDILFGQGKDEVIGADEKRLHIPSRGIVDMMETYERSDILEIKITQLALVEAVDGPEAALNVTDELLGLYARLFGDLGSSNTTRGVESSMAPPKSSSGTIRSIGGSIFGRSKSLRRNMYKADGSVASYGPGESQLASRPKTSASQKNVTTAAPTIQVTDEDGAIPVGQNTHHHHHHPHLHRQESYKGKKLQKSEGSLRRQKSFSSFKKHMASKSVESSIAPERVISPAPQLPVIERQFPSRSASAASGQNMQGYSPTPSQVGLAVSPDIPSPAPSPQPSYQSLSAAARAAAAAAPRTNLPNNLSLSAPTAFPAHHVQVSQSNIEDAQITSIPNPKFPESQDQQQKASLLIKVWLFIATLYRRADMNEDAKGASNEAQKLVSDLERKSPNSGDLNSIDNITWGCKSTISELTGDVLNEQGNNFLALSRPFDALRLFESALSHCIDHPACTVGLSNMLLDISSGVLPPEPTNPSLGLEETALLSPQSSSPSDPVLAHLHSRQNQFSSSSRPPIGLAPIGIPHPVSELPSDPDSYLDSHATLLNSPEVLDKLAARDRAYGLLSSLTKLGSCWDYPDAWFALARAHEESGQIGKAKEVLWWCVELEDARPIRGWREVGYGGYVL